MSTGEWLHEGQRITVSGGGRFSIEGSTDSFETLAEAKAEIDKDLKAEALKAKEHLALAAITGTGVRVTITGLSRVNNEITTTPKVKTQYGQDGSLYPDTDIVAVLLSERAQLQTRVRAIEKTLSAVQLESPQRYGHIELEDYPGLSQQLAAQYATKLAQAQNLKVKP